jgi:ABC-2 type transport system permease protein
VATGALGLLLLSACFIAVGLFISTLTRNQIVAGTLTFGVLLGFWILGWVGEPTSGPLLQVVTYLGLLPHLEQLMKGVVELKDIVFYLSFVAFGLFLAHQSVESQRWRA